jgi:hypothetical protein
MDGNRVLPAPIGHGIVGGSNRSRNPHLIYSDRAARRTYDPRQNGHASEIGQHFAWQTI